MKEGRKAPLFFVYLWQCRKMILGFAAMAALYLAVFYLYQIDTEPFRYATGLAGAAAGIILLAGFVRFYVRHKKNQMLLAHIEQEWKRLQKPETLAEEDLSGMIEALGRRCGELSTRWHSEKQESLDYYTTWVHQIKTPIAVMQMMLQEEDTQEHRALQAELFRIEQYVEMVLCYIRLGSGNTDFVFQEYDLDALIRQTIRKYAPQFIYKKIRLVYEPVQMKVLTDEKWLIFMIEQILSNAIKYTYQGTVTIRVTEDKKLTIKDTGIGIAPEDLPRIFEKGFTGYNGRADQKATGLGLYLCKKAGDKLSIKLTVKSVPGSGSAFTLDLAQKPLEVE